MITARPYKEPARDKLADYKRICGHHQAIVDVRKAGNYWFVRRRWENQHGGGSTDFHILPQGDTSFASAGWFTIAIAEWTTLTERSLNRKTCQANQPIHEHRHEFEGGPLKHHTLPIAKAGDELTLLYPLPANLSLVLVRSKLGQRFAMYFEHLLCPTDEPTTIPNGNSSAT